MNKQKDRLVELLEESSKKVGEYIDSSHIVPTAEEVHRLRADYLLANGIIVPPCKVGRTVWGYKDCFHLPYTEHGKIIPCEVIAIKETKKGKYILLKPLLIETYGMRRVNAWFPFSAIGKTVFLTKEEAEAKLKEGVQ